MLDLKFELTERRQGFRLGLMLAWSGLLFLALWTALSNPFPAGANPGTLYVATTGNNTDNNCTNSNNPCRTVQYAVDRAQEGAGTYTDIHQPAGITQVVYITKTVTIRGG
ncbi:MAG: hypothetical protein ACUVV0_01620 [Anaerolineae bacterium]